MKKGRAFKCWQYFNCKWKEHCPAYIIFSKGGKLCRKPTINCWDVAAADNLCISHGQGDCLKCPWRKKEKKEHI